MKRIAKDAILHGLCQEGIGVNVNCPAKKCGPKASNTGEKINQINESLKIPVNFADSAEITGLINIYKRIQTFCKDDSTLRVSRSALGGLKVTIFLAKDEENLNETIADS